MRRCHLLALLTSLTVAGISAAGPFGKKTNPDVRVPALINVVKTEKDERRRADAADELGDHDGKTFPEILPVLVEALTTDPSSAVRAEAAESIGNLRPISMKAGYALEQAWGGDKSYSVRAAARVSLFQYRVNGYVGSKLDTAVAQTAEPPLAALTDAVKTSPSATLIRPVPSTRTAPPSASMPLPLIPTPSLSPREPANNTSMFPFLNRLNPFARTPAPAPVVAKEKFQTAEPPNARPTPPAPKKEFTSPDEPPASPKAFTPPALVLPTPKQMPATLTSDPKPALDAPAKPVLIIPAPNAVKPPVVTPDEGPVIGPPVK